MPITYSSLLGVLFLGLALAATFTMFHFWGYPYDEVNKKSSCPQWKMNIHRGIGFAYILVYILMMVEMIPRLWEYQVEFPARTVAHLILGTAIGVILLLKVSIIRFFRHFEEWMPVLGASLLMCSILLGVLSLPTSIREESLSAAISSQKNLERVAKLLPQAGFAEETNLSLLSTKKGLERGRSVLLEKCVTCHDLKTIIAKPRTPSDWVRVSRRMIKKPSVVSTISLEEGQFAAAYLIAITPDLQRSAKLKRAEELDRGQSQKAVQELLEEDADLSDDASLEDAPSEGAQDEPVAPDANTGDSKSPLGSDRQTNDEKKKESFKDKKKSPDTSNVDPSIIAPKPPVKVTPKPKFDFKVAKTLFEDECSQCHGLDDVYDEPPTSRKEVNSVMRRMVDNGLELEQKELSLIRGYLIRKYGKKKGSIKKQ